MGDRTIQTQTITSTLVTTYTYDAANRLTNVNTLAGTGGQAYTWDNNGYLTGDGSKTYVYTQANRLTAVSGTGLSWSVTYNGARLKQMANGTPTTYTQDLASPLPVVLQAHTGNTITLYLFDMGTRPLAEYDSAWEYLLPDGLGSVRQLVDSSGNVKLTESYEPYGSVLSSQGSATSAFGFTGEQFDASAQLVFLRARYMQPGLGAFLTEDTVPMNVMQPSDGEEYLYANGNPVNYTDPSGLCVFCRHGDQVKVDARPNGAIEIYEQPRSNSRVITRLPDGYKVQVLSEPTQRGENGWRQIATRLQTGWILNQDLLDNCDGPSGIFNCWPVTNHTWTGGFGANSFACETCGAANKSDACNADNSGKTLPGQTSRCQYCRLRGLHNGLDFGANEHESLVWGNAAEGTLRPGLHAGDGAPNIVIESGGRAFLYGHVSDAIQQRYITVKDPTGRVRPGQTIGESGNQAHLHLGVRNGNVFYNPLNYFSAELQPQIVANMGGYIQGHGVYTMVSFDNGQGGWFWSCLGGTYDYTGITFSKH